MAEPIERGIKSQYARIFEKKDWQIFKSVTEYYFSKAAKLRIKDIEFATNQLLLRNIQKRLFLGIGGELLVKAYFLKSGYYINRPLGKGHNSKLIKFTELD